MDHLCSCVPEHFGPLLGFCDHQAQTLMGIPQSYRQQIFTQFSKFNTFSEGLGLGLSISKQFSVLLGGNLWLDTEYTEGARFVLEVPLDC